MYLTLISRYPVSWLLVTVFNSIMLYLVLKKIFKKETGQSRLAIYP